MRSWPVLRVTAPRPVRRGHCSRQSSQVNDSLCSGGMIMSNSCHSECVNESSSRTHVCPVNSQEYKSVALKTILHHIDSPWQWTKKRQCYYFCDDPNCDVVYFGEDDSVITKTEIRTVVGIKECKPDALTCYCFGVSNLVAQQHPDIRDFIIRKTKAGICSCCTSNPSGRCCLKDFPAQAESGH